MYGAHSYFEPGSSTTLCFELCTALSRSALTGGCRLIELFDLFFRFGYIIILSPTDRTALHAGSNCTTCKVELCCTSTQICRVERFFLAGKAPFHLFLCHPGILREIQGFCMSCQGIEILVVGQYAYRRCRLVTGNPKCSLQSETKTDRCST